MHTKAELLELLRAHQLRLKKRLGQNYLVDPRLTRWMIEACELAATDTVIEIGPGLGALTQLLAERARRVIAVEIDPAICRVLTRHLARYPNIRVACQDILSFDWSAYPGAKVVGAIPYQITSPILVQLCEGASGTPHAWLAVQKEVADRLTASPGTKAYGRLSLLVQYRYDVQRVIRLPRTAFFPPPNVESVWMHLAARQHPPAVGTDEALLFEVIRVAFGQRRKTLVNCLQHLSRPRLTRRQASEVVSGMGWSPTIRGEALSLAEFAQLANGLRDRVFASRLFQV